MTDLLVNDLVVEFVHEKYVIRPIDGLTFEARSREMTVLLGPSGSGKTTPLSSPSRSRAIAGTMSGSCSRPSTSSPR